MASAQSKSSASPSRATDTPVVFTSPSELDAHLRAGDTHDVFVYDGADREVVLRNDCRAYPLRVQATFAGDEPGPQLDRFAERCRSVYGASFESTVPGARTARLPTVASKVGVYAPLDTIEVHFYKEAPREDRRRVIGWLVDA